MEQIYHQLQKNYDTRLDYRKANDFHYGEMEMRRLEPPSDGRFLSVRRRIPRWLNLLTLYRLASTIIERHLKVQGTANPYDPRYTEYFEQRRCFAWRVGGNTRATALAPTTS